MCQLGQKVKNVFFNKNFEKQSCTVPQWSLVWVESTVLFSSRQKPAAKQQNLVIFQFTSDLFIFSHARHSEAFRWAPCSMTQRQISAMSCWAQQAQPETCPELAHCCQKELLLNVRGFASTQKRDFNAFVEWISLPAHQILSVSSPPSPYADSNAMMSCAKACRDQSPSVRTPHNRADCHMDHMMNCPRYRGIWRRKHRMSKRYTIYSRHDKDIIFVA